MNTTPHQHQHGTAPAPEDDDACDVLVIGGGAAGLSGALALARTRRRVIVVDDGRPRNAPAAHVHNLLGNDGTPPAALLARARDDVAGYGGRIVAGRVITAERDGGRFRVTTDGGDTFTARRVLLATGGVDDLPDVPGLADRWGRDVLHCPFCHGWEARDRRIGVIASGPRSVELAQLWRQWTPHVFLLLHGTATPGPDDLERLAARRIAVVPGNLVGVDTDGDLITGVRLDDGSTVALDVLAVVSRLTASVDVVAALGLEVRAVDDGHAGTVVPCDATGATAVPGIWVAGNVADVRATVVTSAAGGFNAAQAITADLVAEDVREAVEMHRRQTRSLVSAEAWEERYRSRPTIWSGRPNPTLVAEAAGLPPGRALDVGCGEGADAIWLADQGWQVTGVDFSRTALERAVEHAAAAGEQVAARTTWQHADLRSDRWGDGEFDLVTAHFVHVPGFAPRDVFGLLAAAVAPGGVLVVVGHHSLDLRTTVGRPHLPDLLFTAQDVVDTLDPDAWQVLVSQARPRTGMDPDGREIVLHDAVAVARRRA
jgi:thioredoxin reductase/2-polyprenyl-3-methyl-5-hydroxy-6-metoxy-1,4-benzoquinol methylase